MADDDRIASVLGHEPVVDAEVAEAAVLDSTLMRMVWEAEDRVLANDPDAATFEPLTLAIGKLDDLAEGDVLVVSVPERQFTAETAAAVKRLVEDLLQPLSVRYSVKLARLRPPR